MAREILKKVSVKGPKGQTGACILYSDGTIRIDFVRFSYPHLKRAHKKEGDAGEAKFSLTSLLMKKTHKAAHALINERMDELLAENKIKKLGADKKFLRDGDESDREEHEGAWTLSAREARRPPLRDRRNEPVEPDDVDEVFRPGFWGTVLVRPWFQNNKHGKRLNAGLSSVQMIMKDEEFGEGRLSEDDLDDTFESYDDDDDGYDDDEEEDDAPRRKKPSSKKPSSKKPRRDDDDDDEDDI